MRISYMQIMNNLMQIGLTVSLAALVPLLLRRVLKKRYPARAVCLVWALLALRLLVPVQLTLPEAPVQVTPRTNYVMQDDRMLFEQAGLPVEQTPARWVTDEQAAALSHAGTSQTTTFNLTAVLLGLWLAGVVISAIRQADVLIVGGTSLTVYPAAGLIRYYRGNKLVLINRDETPYDGYANLIFRDPIGKVLGAI